MGGSARVVVAVGAASGSSVQAIEAVGAAPHGLASLDVVAGAA